VEKDGDSTYSVSTKASIRSSFLSSVDMNNCYLEIPSTNLYAGAKYTLSVSTTHGSNNVTESVEVIVAEVVSFLRSAEDIGVAAENFYVTPSTGIAGETEFNLGALLSGLEVFEGLPSDTYV